ncbi:MAG: hypothetical protein WA418_04195 [Bradyrhizobium sp.]
MLVRAVGNVVALALSLRTNGDIEVLMEAEELDRVIDVLQKARSAIAVSEAAP